MESNSEHPLAEALLQYARQQNKESQLPTVEQFEAIAGSGVRGIVAGQQVWIGTQCWFDEMGINLSVFHAQKEEWEDAGKTVVFPAVEGHLQAAIAVADIVKPNSTNWCSSRWTNPCKNWIFVLSMFLTILLVMIALMIDVFFVKL